ncbi:hypothetical protein [Rhodopila sp.]|jgi:hypothetical protein|uniref:hypothetical protein n=1 Tax=Rhodopila sp. TaxID=2480087 RepID=UPI002CAFB4AA|nr:hypothetical protein [Rhodopila sp.]HVZ09814.1 hypothetical protein [Rhodopila sp.]
MDPHSAARPARRIAALGWLLITLAVVQGGGFLMILWRTRINAPFEDMLQWLDAYRTARHSGAWAAYYLGFFQEHRLVWMKLLTAMDASLFRSTGWVFIAAGTLSLAGVALLLTREFRRGLPSAGPVSALVWLCPMLVLTAANAVDCSVPVNTVYPLTLLCVVGACVAIGGPAEAGPLPTGRGIAAILLAAAAGLANAVGLLAWPVLLWSAWRCRAGTGWLVAIVVTGGVYGVAYLHGLVLSPGGVATGLSASARLGRQLGYLLAYLGLPLSRVPALRLFGEALGLVLLLAAIAAIVRFGLLGPAITRLERIAVGLIMFSLGGAALAALGRSQFAAGIELPVRYTVLVTPLHVGLLALGLRWLADHPRTDRWPGAVLAGGAALAVVLLAQQAVGGRTAVAAADVMRGRIARFYAGQHDPEIEKLVFQTGLDRADAIVAALRREGLLAF